MMPEGYTALVEMLFTFGVVLLWGVYQLWSLRRDRSKKKPSDDHKG